MKRQCGPASPVLGLAVLLLAACAQNGSMPNLASAFQPGGALAAAPADAASRPGAAARSSSNAASAVSASASIQVGKKNVELAATELDPKCKNLVASFNPSDNVADLTAMAAQMAADVAVSNATLQLGSTLSSMVGNKPQPAPKAASLSAGKHQISLTVRRAALRMNWLPMSLERMYGQYLIDQMHDQLLDRDDATNNKLYESADTMLGQVLGSVGVAHAYSFKLFIREDSASNAMALPGGFIVVDQPLIAKPELNNKAWFAIAHEVSHVLQRHETRALQARIIDAVSLKGSLPDLVKTMNGANREPKAIMALVKTGKLQFEKHFADQELQSDACAVRVLDSTLKDNQRLLAVLTTFIGSLPKTPPAAPKTPPNDKASAGLETVVDMVELVSRPIDRHPSSDERLKNLNTMLAEVQGRSTAELVPVALKSQGKPSPGAKPEPPRDSWRPVGLSQAATSVA